MTPNEEVEQREYELAMTKLMNIHAKLIEKTNEEVKQLDEARSKMKQRDGDFAKKFDKEIRSKFERSLGVLNQEMDRRKSILMKEHARRMEYFDEHWEEQNWETENKKFEQDKEPKHAEIRKEQLGKVTESLSSLNQNELECEADEYKNDLVAKRECLKRKRAKPDADANKNIWDDEL